MTEHPAGGWRPRLPGWLGTALCVLITSLWTDWGVIEMFHEGWYRPWEWLFFLLPAGLSLCLTLIALTWPRTGGWLLVSIGAGSYAWLLWRVANRFRLTPGAALSWLPVSGLFALVGALFLVEARRRWRPPPHGRWWRYRRQLVAFAVPALVGIALSIEPAIRVSRRVDDGYRGERAIDCGGTSLVWAPAGPGWVASSSGPTWNEIALYGLPPAGFAGKERGRDGQCGLASSTGCATAADLQRYNVCRYLSEDGTQLLAEPQDQWRLPTTGELVRSLVRHGGCAGCEWDVPSAQVRCPVTPDKETPLWDPKAPVIYYWSADERDAGTACKVAYNGRVDALAKSTGLGSCGYRCVRSQ